MVIGACTLELLIPGSESLKDKRQVIKSLLARLHNEFNVSAAEVDEQDNKRRAVLGICLVSNDSAHANSILSKAVNLVEGEPRASVVNVQIEIL